MDALKSRALVVILDSRAHPVRLPWLDSSDLIYGLALFDAVIPRF